MRLSKLDAWFVGNWTEKSYRRLQSVEGAQGLLFQCPKCSIGKEAGSSQEEYGYREFFRGAHYVLCWFTNPRNAPKVPDDAFPKPGRWTFSGDTIDSITFIGPGAASVLITGKGCVWHGLVTNGDAT